MIRGEHYLKPHLKLNKMKKLVRTIFFSLVELCYLMIISVLIIDNVSINESFDNIFRIIFYVVLFLAPALLLSISLYINTHTRVKTSGCG